mgnify:FL=1
MPDELRAHQYYPVEKGNEDSNLAETVLVERIPQRRRIPAKPFENALRLRRTIPIVSRDPHLSFYLSGLYVQRLTIPRCPLRRLRPSHRAIKGTTDEYAGRLLSLFPELADVEHGEIERTLARMRCKEELEP